MGRDALPGRLRDSGCDRGREPVAAFLVRASSWISYSAPVRLRHSSGKPGISLQRVRTNYSEYSHSPLTRQPPLMSWCHKYLGSRRWWERGSPLAKVNPSLTNQSSRPSRTLPKLTRVSCRLFLDSTDQVDFGVCVMHAERKHWVTRRYDKG